MGLFSGLAKNIFPKHTVLGRVLGSTRSHGTGVVGTIFERKKTPIRSAIEAKPKPKPSLSFKVKESASGVGAPGVGGAPGGGGVSGPGAKPTFEINFKYIVAGLAFLSVVVIGFFIYKRK